MSRRHGEITRFAIHSGHDVCEPSFRDVPIPNPIETAFAWHRLAVWARNEIAKNVTVAQLLECEMIAKGFQQFLPGLRFIDDPAPSYVTGVARLYSGKSTSLTSERDPSAPTRRSA